MEFKPNIMVPVGMRENKETGKMEFYCPRTEKIFGELVKLTIPNHLEGKLKCACFVYLSRKEGSKLMLEFERNKSLPSICNIGINYDKIAYLKAMENEIEKYKKEYNNGEKSEIPKQFYKPEIKGVEVK